MKAGKEFRIWGVRNGWIGDTVMALPVLNHLERNYPGSYKHWAIWRKYAQAAPIYFNHPRIDRIVILENETDLNTHEKKLRDTCEVQINTAPTHPGPEEWFNHYTACEETFRMAGFEVEEFRALPAEERRPRLVPWFETETFTNTVAIWPFAGYNRWSGRSPSTDWWKGMVQRLLGQGFQVLHFGYVTEETLSQNEKYKKLTALNFFDQIKLTLGTEACLDTDSGSSWVIGAYGHPQVNLFTNHFQGHTQNFNALAPENADGRKVDLFAPGGCDNIDQEKVLPGLEEIR